MIPGVDILGKIIKILHSDASPAQIAGGVCMGMVLGLTPLLNIHNLLIVFLILILRVNIGSATLAWGLFSIASFALDPLFHSLGLKLLKDQSLNEFWTTLYNVPGMWITRFNNSIVMGSVAASTALFIPLFVAGIWFVKAYRSHLKEKVEKLRITRIIKGSKLYKWYERLRDV